MTFLGMTENFLPAKRARLAAPTALVYQANAPYLRIEFAMPTAFPAVPTTPELS